MSTQKSGPVVSNFHKAALLRNNDTKPNLSEQFNHKGSYNFALTQARYLERYTPAISSKLNIYDETRVVSPTNYLGIRFIKDDYVQRRYSPAGMDMTNSRKITGEAFTTPFPKMFPQNL